MSTRYDPQAPFWNPNTQQSDPTWTTDEKIARLEQWRVRNRRALRDYTRTRYEAYENSYSITLCKRNIRLATQFIKNLRSLSESMARQRTRLLHEREALSSERDDLWAQWNDVDTEGRIQIANAVRPLSSRLREIDQAIARLERR